MIPGLSINESVNDSFISCTKCNHSSWASYGANFHISKRQKHSHPREKRHLNDQAMNYAQSIIHKFWSLPVLLCARLLYISICSSSILITCRYPFIQNFAQLVVFPSAHHSTTTTHHNSTSQFSQAQSKQQTMSRSSKRQTHPFIPFHEKTKIVHAMHPLLARSLASLLPNIN